MYQAELKHSYKLAAMKLVTPSKEHLEKHYEDLADKPFYKGLVTCTSRSNHQMMIFGGSRNTDSAGRYAEWPHLCYGVGRA